MSFASNATFQNMYAVACDKCGDVRLKKVLPTSAMFLCQTCIHFPCFNCGIGDKQGQLDGPNHMQFYCRPCLKALHARKCHWPGCLTPLDDEKNGGLERLVKGEYRCRDHINKNNCNSCNEPIFYGVERQVGWKRLTCVTCEFRCDHCQIVDLDYGKRRYCPKLQKFQFLCYNCLRESKDDLTLLPLSIPKLTMSISAPATLQSYTTTDDDEVVNEITIKNDDDDDKEWLKFVSSIECNKTKKKRKFQIPILPPIKRQKIPILHRIVY